VISGQLIVDYVARSIAPPLNHSSTTRRVRAGIDEAVTTDAAAAG
jgi:hypothetical protein